MSPSDTLSLITLNTWKCDGDYPRRLTLMRRELARLDPDILALQEVFVDAESQVGTAATLAVVGDHVWAMLEPLLALDGATLRARRREKFLEMGRNSVV